MCVHDQQYPEHASKWFKVLLCSLESCVSCSSHFNAGSGNLQHSPTGSSGQAAIERPQGITVLPRFTPGHRTVMEPPLSKYTAHLGLSVVPLVCFIGSQGVRAHRVLVRYYMRLGLGLLLFFILKRSMHKENH